MGKFTTRRLLGLVGMADQVKTNACQALWLQTATEAHGAGLAFKLGASPLLKQEERDFYRDIIFPDEQRHSKICHDLALELGTPKSIGIFYDEQDDLDTIVSILTVERFFIRGIDHIIQVFGQWGSEFEDGFRVMERDERLHIAHGRRVMKRLVEDSDVVKAARRFRTAAIARFRSDLLEPFIDVYMKPRTT